MVKLFSLEDQQISNVVELCHPTHARGPSLTVPPDDRWILGAQVEISSDQMLVENFQ